MSNLNYNIKKEGEKKKKKEDLFCLSLTHGLINGSFGDGQYIMGIRRSIFKSWNGIYLRAGKMRLNA